MNFQQYDRTETTSAHEYRHEEQFIEVDQAVFSRVIGAVKRSNSVRNGTREELVAMAERLNQKEANDGKWSFALRSRTRGALYLKYDFVPYILPGTDLEFKTVGIEADAAEVEIAVLKKHFDIE